MTTDPASLHQALRDGLWEHVQETCTDALAAGEQAEGRLAALLARAHMRLGLPYEAQEAARLAERRGDNVLVRIAVGEAALAAGDPWSARATLQDALARCNDRGPNWHDVALALAGVLQATGEAEQAYGLAFMALGHAEDRAESDPLALEEALVVYGHAAWASAQLDDAIEALSRVGALRTARDANAVLRAEVEDGLGLCARAVGRPFDAVAHHEAALALWMVGTDVDSGPVGACLHRLAHALHRTGDFGRARDIMAQSLLITARTLGADHVDTWITRFEMARYDVDCGDLEDAFVRMSRARDEVADRLGPQHPVVRAMDGYL